MRVPALACACVCLRGFAYISALLRVLIIIPDFLFSECLQKTTQSWPVLHLIVPCSPVNTHTHTQYHEGMGSELLKIMKSTEVQNPRRKCSAVVEMKLPSGRVPHTVPYRAAYHNYARPAN